MKVETLASAINEMRNGVYDFTDNGECIGCGNCCSNVLPMSKQEIARIKTYMKRNHIKERKHLTPAMATLDLTCPFLDTTKRTEKCTIYKVRPAICRSFKCDKKLIFDKETESLYKEPMTVVDVRSTFFGDN